MIKTSSFYLAGLGACAILAGCIFQDKGNSGKNVQANIELKAASPATLAKVSATSAESLVISDSSGLKFTVTQAHVNVKEMKLEGSANKCAGALPKVSASADDNDSSEASEESCGDEKEFEVKGPILVDLLTGTSNPSVGTLSVPEGVYTKLEIKMGDAEKEDGLADSASGLIGNTLVVSGTYADTNQSPQPFTLSLDFNEELTVKNDSGLVLQDSVVNNVLVSLKVDQWLSKLDVKGCIAKTDTAHVGGAIVISKDSQLGKCLDIENTVKANIRGSFEVDEKDD